MKSTSKAPSRKAPRRPKPEAVPDDLRESLVNGGETGSIEQISLPEANIVSHRGILLDIDRKHLGTEALPPSVLRNPKRLYESVVRDWLARHPVLAAAEVLDSGGGLHVVIRLDEPVEFRDAGHRQRWAGIVRAVQCVLPTDPDCPGITATTRVVGSRNSKSGRIVTQLKEATPVSAAQVESLFADLVAKPFRTIAAILFGGDRVNPCPVCDGDDTSLAVLDRFGHCYGACGKVRVGQLHDVFLRPRGKGGKDA